VRESLTVLNSTCSGVFAKTTIETRASDIGRTTMVLRFSTRHQNLILISIYSLRLSPTVHKRLPHIIWFVSVALRVLRAFSLIRGETCRRWSSFQFDIMRIITFILRLAHPYSLHTCWSKLPVAQYRLTIIIISVISPRYFQILNSRVLLYFGPIITKLRSALFDDKSKKNDFQHNTR
jgi:hypothetical protein